MLTKQTVDICTILSLRWLVTFSLHAYVHVSVGWWVGVRVHACGCINPIPQLKYLNHIQLRLTFLTEALHFRCHHPAENWLCLSCKDVLCSRFINKHMLSHHQETGHCLALSFRCIISAFVFYDKLISVDIILLIFFLWTCDSDLSVWCFSCEAYLDVKMIWQLRPVYEVAHLLKFGQSPPFLAIESLQLSTQNEGSSSGS